MIDVFEVLTDVHDEFGLPHLILKGVTCSLFESYKKT